VSVIEGAMMPSQKRSERGTPAVVRMVKLCIPHQQEPIAADGQHPCRPSSHTTLFKVMSACASLPSWPPASLWKPLSVCAPECRVLQATCLQVTAMSFMWTSLSLYDE
jgi:hypothetical protein